MDFYSILVAILLSFTLVKIPRLLSAKKQLPPGPFPWPVIGNLHQLGNYPHKSLARLARKYGPVMTLKLGMTNAVVISSSAIAREALQKQDSVFSGRFVPDALKALKQSQFSVIWLPPDSTWRALRRIMISNAFSANRLDENQQLRARKIEELVMYCRKQGLAGEAVDIGRAAFRTALNLISNIIFSRDLTDPFSDSTQEFKELVWNIELEAGKPNMVDCFPFLEMFDPQRIRRRMTSHLGKVFDMLDDLIDQRLDRRKATGNKNVDLLDSLLNISQDKPEELDRTHILHMCSDLFLAGIETSSSTLEWAMAELFKNPETMAKAQAELAKVVGRAVSLREDDLICLPYLQCVVKETLRLHPPFLLNMRRVEQDTTLRGYTIPKGTKVLVNVWAIGRDPDTWENASSFEPERFLNSKMDVRGQDFELIPFGAGRRICPGLPMAMRTIPMMLGSLLNSFDWKLEDDIKELNMDDKFGLASAKAHPLRAVPIPF